MAAAFSTSMNTPAALTSRVVTDAKRTAPEASFQVSRAGKATRVRSADRLGVLVVTLLALTKFCAELVCSVSEGLLVVYRRAWTDFERQSDAAKSAIPWILSILCSRESTT
jgi:hypothetical protein